MTVHRGHTERAENEKEKPSMFSYKGRCSGGPLKGTASRGGFHTVCSQQNASYMTVSILTTVLLHIYVLCQVVLHNKNKH